MQFFKLTGSVLGGCDNTLRVSLYRMAEPNTKNEPFFDSTPNLAIAIKTFLVVNKHTWLGLGHFERAPPCQHNYQRFHVPNNKRTCVGDSSKTKVLSFSLYTWCDITTYWSEFGFYKTKWVAAPTARVTSGNLRVWTLSFSQSAMSTSCNLFKQGWNLHGRDDVCLQC